jgi:hypothetical protein
MRAASLRWAFLALFIMFFIMTIVAIAMHSGKEGGIGVGMSWSGEDYLFSASAPPWALAFTLVSAVLCVALLLARVEDSSRPMPHLFRRFVAGLVDWAIALVMFASVQGLVSVLIEYHRAGVFNWVIDRHERQPWDIPEVIIGTLVVFAAMTVYFAAFFSKGKPTPGACIAGYRVRADENFRLTFRRAALRALLGSMALLGWPCWILAYVLKREKAKGKFWLDVIFRTHAEFLS